MLQILNTIMKKSYTTSVDWLLFKWGNKTVWGRGGSLLHITEFVCLFDGV